MSGIASFYGKIISSTLVFCPRTGMINSAGASLHGGVSLFSESGGPQFPASKRLTPNKPIAISQIKAGREKLSELNPPSSWPLEDGRGSGISLDYARRGLNGRVRSGDNGYLSDCDWRIADRRFRFSAKYWPGGAGVQTDRRPGGDKSYSPAAPWSIWFLVLAPGEKASLYWVKGSSVPKPSRKGKAVKKKKFYALVHTNRQIEILHDTWKGAERKIKGVSNLRFKGFSNQETALKWAEETSKKPMPAKTASFSKSGWMASNVNTPYWARAKRMSIELDRGFERNLSHSRD